MNGYTIKVAAGDYELSEHAEDERQADRIPISEVEHALLGGCILENYPDAPRGPSCLVLGYASDDCSFCGGRVTERPVLKACWWGGQLLALVDGVPAGVCEQCGERYYRAAVLKQVESLLQTQEHFRRIEVPLAEYTAAG